MKHFFGHFVSRTFGIILLTGLLWGSTKLSQAVEPCDPLKAKISSKQGLHHDAEAIRNSIQNMFAETPALQSVESRHKGLSEQVIGLWKYFPDTYLEVSKDPQVKVKTLIENIIDKRNTIAKMLRKMKEEVDPKNFEYGTLDKAAKKIEFDLNKDRNLSSWLTQNENIIFDKKDKEHSIRIQTLSSPIYGEMGELIVAFQVSDPMERGIKIRALLDKAINPAQKKVELQKLQESNSKWKDWGEKEVDLVFGKDQLGEVKNFRNVLNIDEKNKNWTDLKKQAENMRDIRNAFKSSFDIEYGLHYYILGGIRQEAAEFLQKMGFTVHAQIITP